MSGNGMRYCCCSASTVEGLKPAMVMVVVQIVFAGVNVFYKLAINDGMNLRILVAYRYLFAAVFLAPVAFFIERKNRPKLTWMLLFQAFLCGLFGGALAQNLYVASLSLTSATFTSAMTNLIPAMTFIMAVAFGLERLAVRTIAGKAKVVGTLIGISGAMLLTFYKGVEIKVLSAHLLHLHDKTGKPGATSHLQSGNHVLGSLLAVGSCLCYSTWLIIQAKMSETYPCHYSSTAMMCTMGSIQAIIFALCSERDWAQWRLALNIRLLTVAYSGILASGLMVTIVAWCVHLRGPLFGSIFNPLMLVMVALAGCILLNENLHLGSILGAILIVSGLYVVLWGKSKEMQSNSLRSQRTSSKTSITSESERISVVITSSSNRPNSNASAYDLNSQCVSFHNSDTKLETKSPSNIEDGSVVDQQLLPSSTVEVEIK